MYVFANNRIQRPNKEGTTEVIPARTVFEADTDQFKELESLGAARKATNEEIAIYKDKRARATGQTVTAAPAIAETPVDDLVGKSVAELKAIAESENIDLGDATKKDDILAKIRAARADADNMLG